MTREEAISQLISLNEEDVSIYSDAVEYAIGALEQEPCEDCISRADALSACAEFNGAGYVWSCIRERISKLPSVNPQEPKTGHWVLDGSDNSLECINCGCVIHANDIMRGEPHYCPNCGRRMSEVSE